MVQEMLEAGAKHLTRYCRRRAGDQLRSVTIYTPEGTDIVYQREGFRESYTDEQVVALVEGARDLNNTLHQTDIEKAPLGRPIAGVYSFEEAFVIQLPWDETTGVVATFDSDIGTSLAGFIDDCQRVLWKEHPRELD